MPCAIAENTENTASDNAKNGFTQAFMPGVSAMNGIGSERNVVVGMVLGIGLVDGGADHRPRQRPDSISANWQG